LIVQELPADLYRQTIFFVYGTQWELNFWFKLNYPNAARDLEFTPGQRGKFCEYVPASGSQTTQFICLVQNEGMEVDTRAGWLAHECVHAAVAILEAKGIPISVNTDETLTYYFQWLFLHCLDYLRTS
jgi:hypothetical protein